jgi:branched-chain amino acid transport system permease protein
MKPAVGFLIGIGLLLAPLVLIEPRIYLTLTIAGLAMGMLIFLVAAGLTLIFGLMDVLNFAHGALFSWGAYVGFSMVVAANRRWAWADSPSVLDNGLVLLLAALTAMTVAAGLGILVERIIVRPVYGRHLFQILITLGATIVLEELIRIGWGPNDQVMPVPRSIQGSWDLADIVVLRVPALAIALGLAVYGVILLVLKRTRVGLIVRAGVENGEITQTMGHNIYRYFTAVFAAGSALAALGGLMWAIFRQSVSPAMGAEQLIFAFIVVIIGGLGSVTGSLLGALIVGLAYNYVAFLLPKAAIGVTMALMVVTLLVRPTGLFGAAK